MTAAAIDLTDRDAITEVVQRYIDGAISGKGEDMKPAFQEAATIFGHAGSDRFAGPIQQLFDFADATGPAAALRARIASIDLVDTIATVRLELEDWTGFRFTDLFTLLKTDGAWKITNKVFHLHA